MIVKVINKGVQPLPKFETPGSAGADVRADFSRIQEYPIKVYGGAEVIAAGEAHEKVMIKLTPHSRALIPTGLFMAVPTGYEMQVRPRSGLALKEGLTVINTPGTVDSDYRNEVGVVIINTSTEDRFIEDGERIAQMVIARHEQGEFIPVDVLDETERGEGGYGHTGVK
jgi:dUTP pyrophosphatase